MAFEQHLEKLNEPFPTEILEKKEMGGQTFHFVPHPFVTERLNECLGVGGWSFEVITTQWVEPLDTVLAHGRLTAVIEGQKVVKEQWGGQLINRKAKKPDGSKGDIVELTNDYKGAASDALRKCASLLGVAEELYMNKFRLPKNPPPQKPPTPLAQPQTSSIGEPLKPNLLEEAKKVFGSDVVTETKEPRGKLGDKHPNWSKVNSARAQAIHVALSSLKWNDDQKHAWMCEVLGLDHPVNETFDIGKDPALYDKLHKAAIERAKQPA